MQVLIQVGTYSILLSKRWLRQNSNLLSIRPFVITNLQCQLKTTTIYVVPILHATIYGVPALS